ncbi:DUF4145 domain-containing protein [Bacteroides reticulotermitis]|uniref:DUF4145 domain-containing protein n=2 Tax=Bacteroides reticulotermitis TaxID=1133319 RepID=W4V1F4_9BACE|nr:DUF4145 domain-containing protein [Bacteroides reticulotermitis]MBB4046466.1 hypothetical protein [Bacteroides reticulotermitis]GAE86633.1 hypothetical protein JCM10512_5165 [Bacteroides reticulotermitis JCM 10512]
MNIVDVPYYENGKFVKAEIENASMECPFCGITMIPEYHFCIYHGNECSLDVFSQCTNASCENTFIAEFLEDVDAATFHSIKPLAMPSEKTFSDILNELSPNFIEIYNQSHFAEQLGLNQICGTGYRKALEFLIKDYLMSINSEDKHQDIKTKFLNNCIRDDIDNANIKKVAVRAVWLGNDETHYIRKWENKDISDLKTLIGLTIHYIESEIQAKILLEEMSEFKS